MKKPFKMAKNIYNAIVFWKDKAVPVRKYRNISNISSFTNFVISIKGDYFNLYDKKTKLYVERIYIKKGT